MSGTGSIRKLTSGRYQARLTDDNGTRRSIGTYLTKKAAYEALRATQVQIDQSTYLPEISRTLAEGKKLTLADAAAMYRLLGTRGGKPLSPRTTLEYESYIRRDLAHIADRPLNTIRQQDVEEWWIEMGNKGTLALRTKVYSHLKSVMMFACRKGWIASDPCQIRGGSQSPRTASASIPTSNQVHQIVNNAPAQYKALFALAAWGGIRKGELLELRRSDITKEVLDGELIFTVQIRRAVIWLPGGDVQIREPKWESVRNVMMPTHANILMQAHLNQLSLHPDALLFPESGTSNTHLGNHKLNRIWYKARATAGYFGTFHSLRSYAGTAYSMAGATLRETMDRLGHSNSATAMRYQKNAGRESLLIRNLN